jgi:hypothetical protein
VVLHGVSWYPNTGRQVGSGGNTVISQLPDTEDDLIIFGYNATFGAGNLIAFNGLTDIDLWGPEKDVNGVSTPSVGSGVNLRVEGQTWGVPIDGFKLSNVKVSEFPEAGFKCHGAIPLYLDRCKSLSCGTFGFELERYAGNSTNALRIENFSGDWNNKGLIGLKDLDENDTVFISGIKSEGFESGDEADLTGYGSPGYQSSCIVMDNCDDTVIDVNGVSHIRVARADDAAGPGMEITDDVGVPRLSFSGVLVRVSGDETGSTADAVTIRDHVSTTDVARTYTSGYYNTTPYMSDESS